MTITNAETAATAKAASPNPDPKVQEIVHWIQFAAGPQAKVTVIGSRARGANRPDSDLDVMVDLYTGADKAAALDRWDQFNQQAPQLIEALEAQYGLTIDGMLVEGQRSLTEFYIVSMRDASAYGMVNTDLPCDHPDQLYCGNCHVCGRHQELSIWRTISGFVTVCRECWNVVETITDRLVQASACLRKPDQAQAQAQSHAQTCSGCFELQPDFKELLEQTAQERNVAGPRSCIGSTSNFWIRFNL